jgi:hypothetical protein
MESPSRSASILVAGNGVSWAYFDDRIEVGGVFSGVWRGVALRTYSGKCFAASLVWSARTDT